MRARPFVAAAAGVAWIAATHWLMTAAPASPWNAVVVVAPMLIGLGCYACERRQWLGAVAALVATGALVWQGAHGGGVAAETLYLAQHASIHAALALVFAATLASGREPLVTALARRVHTALTPAMAAYCRRLTAAWSVYFAAMAALSLLLFAALPFAAWAAFANLGTPLVLALFVVGEYVLRYRWHPEFERATLASAMRAYAERQRPDASA